MLQMTIAKEGTLNVLCLGAHCDDVEIGCGATLLQLLESRNAHITCVVFASDEIREAETRHALSMIANHSLKSIEIEVLHHRNGYFPYEGALIKDQFERLKARSRPDIIFTHHLNDRHQDHRLIAELTWNTFRDHCVLEYEIPKFDGDLGTPNVFFPISEALARRKVDIIRTAFRSQSERQWFDDATFMALMRLRGIECNAPGGLAEAFHCRKARVSF